MLVLTGNKKGPGKSKPTVEFCGWIVAQLFYFCQGLKIADDMLHCPFILGVGPTSYMSFVQPISASLSLATFAAKLVMRQWGEHAFGLLGFKRNHLFRAFVCIVVHVLPYPRCARVHSYSGSLTNMERLLKWKNHEQESSNSLKQFPHIHQTSHCFLPIKRQKPQWRGKNYQKHCIFPKAKQGLQDAWK